MFNPPNYRNILAQKMPGELSPDLLDKIVKDIAVMASKLPPKKLFKMLSWYLHGVATARCFKAMPSIEIVAATIQVADELATMLQKDIQGMVAGKPAA